jgi:hypothetical protein
MTLIPVLELHADEPVSDELVQPAALEITEHGSPALGRLAMAVLSTASSS